jgi:formylglycine-generating enzyme required for sulfatase activity
MIERNNARYWANALLMTLMTVAFMAMPAASSGSPQSSSSFKYETNALGMDFVSVPAGEFAMGCSEGAKPTECEDDERPRHLVQISNPFQIQKTEVTQKQWQTVMGSNPSDHTGELDLPVEQVSFEQVQQFLAKLNERNDGYVYRLPTEAEWEYAARAGTKDQYAGSLTETAWFSAGGGEGGGGADFKEGKTITRPVATKKPNAWGIYDMRGNVQEWVQDWFDPDYYSQSPKTDPKGPSSGDGRVVRGGSYHVYPWLTRVSVRSQFPEAYQFNDVGFRVARVAK